MILSAIILFSLPQVQVDQIPGLIAVPRGKVVIGMDRKVAEEFILHHPGSAKQLGGCTPQSRQNVEAFFISPTEITNEMYQRFVAATGAQPPVSWVDIPPKMNLALIQWGKEKFGPAFTLNAQAKAAWWADHWQDKEWQGFPLVAKMPPEAALMPIAFCSYDDTLAYCRWAGLRLPTELEWVRAAIGDKDWPYPWGDKFDASLLAFEATKPVNLAHKMMPVNSFPGNASPFGCVDMAGNAWEWTGTGYDSLEGFSGFSVKTPAGLVEAFPDFDPGSPVIKGGSFMNPDYISRVDFRVGVVQQAKVEHISFRVAADTAPCRTAASYATAAVNAQVMGGSGQRILDLDGVLGLEKRRYVKEETLKANRAKPKGGIKAPEVHKDYRVFDGYDYLSVIPVKKLEVGSLEKLRREVTDGGPVHLGVIHSSVALQEPVVQPGTYILAYLGEQTLDALVEKGAMIPEEFQDMAKGKAKPKEVVEDEEEDLQDRDRWPDLSGIELRPLREYLLVIDMEQKALGAIPLRGKPVLETERKAKKEITLDLGADAVNFSFPVVCTKRGRVITFRFPLRPLGQEGSLVSERHWDGDYFQIKQPE
ncbi:MAG: hypothetical protein DWQ01_14875 [Planctomycetota bacterium]|nr:MAG: hypothetical protein DWQ01_14875 [Planctomycetota bacterium]